MLKTNLFFAFLISSIFISNNALSNNDGYTEEEIERNRIRYGEVYDKPDGGDILGFPMPVIEAMLREQEKQGNPRSILVFKNARYSSKNNGGFEYFFYIYTC